MGPCEFARSSLSNRVHDQLRLTLKNLEGMNDIDFIPPCYERAADALILVTMEPGFPFDLQEWDLFPRWVLVLLATKQLGSVRR